MLSSRHVLSLLLLLLVTTFQDPISLCRGYTEYAAQVRLYLVLDKSVFYNFSYLSGLPWYGF